jgi:hypothetical protein
MEKIHIIAAALAAFLFTGCAGAMQHAGEEYIKANGYNDDATFFCYDWLDKKPCPAGLLQVDLDVFSAVPGMSRFCFGFTDANATAPVGMICVRRDFVEER